MTNNPTPTPASINPDGSPGNVASGEFVEAAWGNAVADEFQRLKTIGSAVCTIPAEVTGAPTVYRRAGIAIVNMNFTLVTKLSIGQLMFTLPVGYRPNALMFITAYDTTGPVLTMLNVATNGQVTIQNMPAANGRIIRGSAAWAIGS